MFDVFIVCRSSKMVTWIQWGLNFPLKRRNYLLSIPHHSSRDPARDI